MEAKKVIYLESYMKEWGDTPLIFNEIKSVPKKRKGWMGLPRKTRKAISLSIITLLLSIIVFMICSKMLTGAYRHGQQKVVNQLANYEKVQVVVKKGETVWELQEKLTPNSDIREMLYLAEKENGKKLGVVCEGEMITLLKK